MIKKKIALVALVIVTLTISFGTSCYKSATVDLRGEQEITEAVSYTANIVPVFEKSCSLSGCHNAGGVAPDLSSANAYNALSNGGYIDVATPRNSKIYGFVSGRLTPVMPVSGADPEIAAIILAWIQQGALNN